MSVFILQMMALIALIYNFIVVAGLIVWIVRSIIEDRRQYYED